MEEHVNRRPTNIVEDEGFTVLQTASSDPSYKPPCRATVTAKSSKTYDGKKEKQTWDFGGVFKWKYLKLRVFFQQFLGEIKKKERLIRSINNRP